MKSKKKMLTKKLFLVSKTNAVIYAYEGGSGSGSGSGETAMNPTTIATVGKLC